MNIKYRLEKAAESKQWVRVYFHDGSAIVGRVTQVGQDYLELESYGSDDAPDSRNFARNMIPLSFIKMFTLDSSSFAEAERKRLQYINQLDPVSESLAETEKNKLN